MNSFRVRRASLVVTVCTFVGVLGACSQVKAPRGKEAAKKGGDGAPKVGEVAPAFTLKSLDGKQEFALASRRGERPVILFFGSYT